MQRETIESALRRVQLGELSPSEATQWLLRLDAGEPLPAPATAAALSADAPKDHVDRDSVDRDSAGLPQDESLASLISRLGTPPADIVDAWCDQARWIALRFQRQHQQPLPAIDLSRWWVTPAGDLRLDRVLARGSSESVPDSSMELSEESLARLEEFHGAVSQPIADDGANREVALETDSFTAEGAATPARAADSRGRTKVWKAASLFALLVGVAGGAYFLLPIPFGAEPDAWSESAGAPADGDLVARGSSPPPPDVATGPEAKRIAESTEPRPGGMAAADELVLETLQDPVEEAPSMLEVTGMETETSFALDDLMPPAASFVPDVASLVPHGDDSDRPESDSTPDPADSVAAELAPESMPMSTDGETSPEESPQPTRRTPTVTAIQLPSPDGDAVRLSDKTMTGLRLQFPFESPLDLQETAEGWQVRDPDGPNNVATIGVGDEASEFRWEGEPTSTLVSTLSQGRLVDSEGKVVYLRPHVTADPWPVRVGKSDEMPSWDLGHPIGQRGCRVSIAFDLPKEVEEAWIEPVESDSPRRTRAVAMVTPQDGETVALGIRLDVRCGRKLSCRVRYAGRLDPSMPWQVVSTAGLEQFASQLSAQAIVVRNEADRLDRVERLADAAGRRILQVKQERNDQRAESIAIALERVAELQSLIARLEAAATLRLRLWVEWPDREQVLFSMTSPEQQEASDDHEAGEERS